MINVRCIRAVLTFLAFSVATTGLAADARELTDAEMAGATDVGYRTVVIREMRAVTGDLTVPQNVALRLEGSGALQVTEGKTVTINGSLDAPMQQVFHGPGRIVFGPGRSTRSGGAQAATARRTTPTPYRAPLTVSPRAESSSSPPVGTRTRE